MQSRHLISNTKYAVAWKILFPSVKIMYREKSFGEFAKCGEITSWVLIQYRDVIVPV